MTSIKIGYGVILLFERRRSVMIISALLFVTLVIIGYLSGSICSAVIVSRLFSLPDPRQEGSLNPGATNVLRLAGKKFAALVLVTDIVKGILPVVLGHLLGVGFATLGFIGFAAVLGHIYPFFFEYKGGKGVATALGALLGLHFILGVIVLAIWLLIANFTRYSSLASIIAMIAAPFLAIVTVGNADVFPPLLLMMGFIIYKHRENINRLIEGDEPKIQLKRHQLADLAEEILEEREAPVKPAEAKQPLAKNTSSSRPNKD